MLEKEQNTAVTNASLPFPIRQCVKLFTVKNAKDLFEDVYLSMNSTL